MIDTIFLFIFFAGWALVILGYLGGWAGREHHGDL